MLFEVLLEWPDVLQRKFRVRVVKDEVDDGKAILLDASDQGRPPGVATQFSPDEVAWVELLFGLHFVNLYFNYKKSYFVNKIQLA